MEPNNELVYLQDVITPERECEGSLAGRSPQDGAEVNFHPRHRLNTGQPEPPKAGPRREENGGPEQPMLMGNTVRMNPQSYDGTDDWEKYQVYFEQLTYESGWDPLTIAMVLILSLRGAAQTVLTSSTQEQRRDCRVLV